MDSWPDVAALVSLGRRLSAFTTSPESTARTARVTRPNKSVARTAGAMPCALMHFEVVVFRQHAGIHYDDELAESFQPEWELKTCR